MADEPHLRRGDAGDWVVYLQQLLERAGGGRGAIDGSFGPLTEQAVQAFQRASGFDADGTVGPQTWSALVAGGARDDAGDDVEVPAELVLAGAPARLSAWSDEQRYAYFHGTGGEQVGGDAPDDLAVEPIERAVDGSTT